MRIVIDLQGAQTMSRYRGIGRYTLSFTRALIRQRGDHEILIALNGLFPHTIESIAGAFEGLLPRENIRVWYAPGPLNNMESGNEWRQGVAEILREAFIASLRPDAVYISSFLEGFSDSAVISVGRFDQNTPVVASLYDLIPLTNPKAYLDPYPVFQKFYFKRMEQLEKTRCLLAISDFCAREGGENLPNYAGTITSVSSAIESDFQPVADYAGRDQDFAERFGIHRPYVLYTGGADDRKNLPALIAAFAKLPTEIRKAHQLVFAGKLHDQEQRKVLRAGRSERLQSGELVLAGYVSDEELKQLYSYCAVYAFPSWHEGFGLPALEAMACGAPVIGARASSLPEVIGFEQAMFDPFNHNDILSVLRRSLEDEDYREQLRLQGSEQVRKFSWERTARLAWAAIEDFGPLHQHRFSWEEISEKLIEKTAAQIKDERLNDLELARIADCIERNRIESSRAFG